MRDPVMRRGVGWWVVVLMLTAPTVGEAFDGLSFTSKLLNPGKLDFHYRHTNSTNEYNTFWWSPTFKGGFGITQVDDAQETDYVGGFVRPLSAWPQLGDVILGFEHLGSATADDHELQGEYRLPIGLGVGGGFVQRTAGGVDIQFGKVSFRNKLAGWNYILEAQGQDMADHLSPGGYVALYNDQLMVTYGNDGESWRSAIGYIAPEMKSIFRPVAEVLYVDNAIGHLDGAQFLFANASLKYQGGFLSHPARLGRAMGPTGLEFGNPLGFLDANPTWNRRLDVWELGGLGDARLVWNKTAAGVITWRADALVFPFQFVRTESILDGIFLGGFYSGVKGKSSPGILGGVFRKIGFLQVGTGVDYNFDTNETRVDVGLIDKF